MINSALNYSFVSFDVFDTLITRRTLQPIDIFQDVESRLTSTQAEFVGFAERRRLAELKARELHNFGLEVSLQEIYDQIGSQFGMARAHLDQAMRMELDLESQQLTPIPFAIRIANALRERGKQIAFISDIYLTKAFIEKTLQRFDILQSGDLLFVSSETRAQKSSGKLFELINQNQKIAYSDWCHFGDNLESDVRRAEHLGINAVHTTQLSPNRYEPDKPNALPVRKMLGCARVNRLKNPYTEHRSKVIWNTSSNVSGLLIFNLVAWCIQRAIKDKIDTLYFLSRDGQVMHKIAEKIIAKHYHGQIRCKYLYVSRQALLFPALMDLTDSELEWILAPTAFLSVRTALSRIHFDVAEIEDDLRKAGLSHYDRNMTEREIAVLKNVLIMRSKEIVERASSFRDRAIEYLRQEGVLDQDRVGVVDIGWSGTLQRSISRILDAHGSSSPVYGYYFGVKRRKTHKHSDKMFGWFTDCEDPRPLDQKVYIIPMTELFTAADHGGVRCYEDQQGNIVPVLKSKENKNGIDWGVLVQQEAMCHLADELLVALTRSELEQLPSQALDQLEVCYEQFLLTPSRAEADVYTAYLDSEDQNEAFHVRMGSPYSFDELKKFFSEDFMHHHNEWRQGSLAISNPQLVQIAYEITKSEQQLS